MTQEWDKAEAKQMYLIICDFGSRGPSCLERDLRDMDWHHTVEDIATGQVERVRQVIEFDLAAGTCRDVTARMEREVRSRRVDLECEPVD